MTYFGFIFIQILIYSYEIMSVEHSKILKDTIHYIEQLKLAF